jgi:SpoVK/Ycf46/Vps4 family AAA+-type ATPase
VCLGTGKTSLCKALAQKLSIRLSHRYAATVFLEINAHSLFSKWFSESGKLVLKLFEQIRNMLEQEDCLFCVLMDEVESLTAARQAALSGSEPSDAIRVVNALLTQLDRLKRYRNVLILTTSNITDAIDTAFVDRADIKQYIGSPSAAAIHEILRSCVTELARKGLVTVDPKSRGVLPWGDVPANAKDNENDPSRMLADVATLCATHQFSGRTLRKLPFQSFARFCQVCWFNFYSRSILWLIQSVPFRVAPWWIC